MGLGKTIVILAYLARRCETRAHDVTPRPTLIVVPTSVVFNWKEECARFTPQLKLLVHHGSKREAPGAHFDEQDVIVTTYGVLRKDADALTRRSYDLVVLDEAHNIKNADTEAHRVALELESRQRIALSGTPLENHVLDLWNLLSFLNPALFRHLGHLRKVFERKRASDVALEGAILPAFCPFLLRRTKEEVARELPPRIEQTLYVELSTSERREYTELAKYYKNRILESRKIRRRHGPSGGGSVRDGSRAAEALSALLRLRQLSCHAGLIDVARRHESSSKIDALLTHLIALRGRGHKALVFSQFTSLLDLLAPRLEQLGIGFESLDGRTRDRRGAVERFSEDRDVSVFLISLKAGGVGLNLVAADYVFILDPWWNPAAEAQAIDRAHRIGQERPVIAYRLLARGTVEEKVAHLSQDKRQLAAALFEDIGARSTSLDQEALEALLTS
jgi:SNF2 family DNA or RNA helicase